MEKYDLFSFLLENYQPDGFVVGGLRNLESCSEIILKRISRKAICPKCGKESNIEAWRRKKARDLDLIKKCYIEFEQAKVRCRCGYRGMERLEFIVKHSRYTKRFEEYVATLAKTMSLADTADICDIDWKSAKQMFYRARRPL